MEDKDNFGFKVASVEETWDISENEGTNQLMFGSGVYQATLKTYTLNHSIGATGKRTFKKQADYAGLYPEVQADAWQEASGYVLTNTLGNKGLHNVVMYGTNSPNDSVSPGTIDHFTPASGITALNLPDYYRGYNYTRSQTVDKRSGSFNVQESWILASGGFMGLDLPNAVTEEINFDISSANDDLLSRVSINGSIGGLVGPEVGNLTNDASDIDGTTEKFAAASGYFYSIVNNKLGTLDGEIFLRARNFAQIALNPIPLSNTLAYNVNMGTIDYSYEFNEEPDIKKVVLRDVSKIEWLVNELKSYLLEETAPCALTEK